MLFLCLLNIKIALHTPLLEGEVATKHVGAALRIVAIVDTASHLGVVARIVGDGEEVAGLSINAQVRDAPSVQQLLRQGVAQLYVLQAEVRSALKEAARVEHIVSALGVRNGAIGVILGPYVAHLGAEL